MYSSVILVVLFYLTVSINGLNAELDSLVANKTESDVSLTNNNETIANRMLADAVLNSSEETTVQSETLEITKAIATDSPDIAARIGLNLEPPPAESNGFIPSFLKTFRRKRNLVVNEDKSTY